MTETRSHDLWPSYPHEHKFDERDAGIVQERMATLNMIEGPRVGDHVDFADGTHRRISYIWPGEDGEAGSVQTSDGGSYYLGHGYVSMSGSLFTGVKPETLTPTGTRPGAVWIFHHDFVTAHNGVHTRMPFRVYTCTEPAPTV